MTWKVAKAIWPRLCSCCEKIIEPKEVVYWEPWPGLRAYCEACTMGPRRRIVNEEKENPC